MPFAIIKQISQKRFATCSIIGILIFYTDGFIIIDATRSIGKVVQRTVNVDELFADGYEIYRKNSEIKL